MPVNGTTNQRGYGSKHQQLRAKLRPQVDAGLTNCWRCGRPIQPGQRWDLGHDDHDRTMYRGPEHARRVDCPAGGNRRAGAIKGNKQRGADSGRNVGNLRRWKL